MKIREERIDDFLNALGSKTPTPSGGGAASLCAAIGSMLGSMVIRFTLGKKKYAAYEAELSTLLTKLDAAKEKFLLLADEDETVFLPLAKAYGMPKETPEETEKKKEALETALLNAAGTPLSLMELCLDTLSEAEALTRIGTKLAISDVGICARLLRAAAESAYLNVVINTRSMSDKKAARAMEERAEALREKSVSLSEQIYGDVLKQILK